jgi:hypothetical protein
MKEKFKDPAYRSAHKRRQENRIQNNTNIIPFSIIRDVDVYGPFHLQKDSYGKVPIGATSINRLYTGELTTVKGYQLIKHK